MIKNLLWFCEGALFNTHPAMTYAVSQSLNDFGVTAALNVIDGLVRRSLEYGLESMALRYKLDYEELYKKFLQHYRAIPVENQPAFAFTAQSCELIFQQGGKNIALTQYHCTPIKELLAYNNMVGCFSGLIQTQQSQHRSEREEIYDLSQSLLFTLENFALEKANTLLVASREIEIHTGLQIGLRTCQVGFANSKIAGDFRFDNHSQLLALLQQPNPSNQR